MNSLDAEGIQFLSTERSLSKIPYLIYMKEVTVIFLVLILTGAVVFDLSTDKIPNKYLIAGYLLISVLKFNEVGLVGFGSSFIRSILLLVLMFPFFLTGLFGGGDVKLIGIIAFCQPLKTVLITLVVSLFVAGFISIVKLIRFGIHGDGFSGLIRYLIKKATVIRMRGIWEAMEESYIRMEGKEVAERGIHFSVPLLAAVIFVMWGTI